jgi:hypothetical protein
MECPDHVTVFEAFRDERSIEGGGGRGEMGGRRGRVVEVKGSEGDEEAETVLVDGRLAVLGLLGETKSGQRLLMRKGRISRQTSKTVFARTARCSCSSGERPRSDRRRMADVRRATSPSARRRREALLQGEEKVNSS